MATRTVTRTIVFTDIADYTASVGRAKREELRELISAHEKTVAPVLERHGGRVVKNLGDSFMALFESATDAVRSALELVEAVTESNDFMFRVAMATGDVEEIEREGDYDAFGEAVNLASRVLSKTPAGEVWFSTGTQVCMNQAEIPWESVGTKVLKGITGEPELFRAVPSSRCWLAPVVQQAAESGKLCRIRRGESLPSLPTDPIVLLEGFTPGTDDLSSLIDKILVAEPARLWLSTYNIAPSDRYVWEQAGRGLVIGYPDALERAIQESGRRTSLPTGSDTIIIEVGAIMEIVLAGVALPRVPMSQVVSGYTYDLLPDGRWVNKSDNAIARIEVTGTQPSITGLAPGLMLQGRRMIRLPPGRKEILEDGDKIVAPSGPITFTAVDDKGYLGCLVAETMARQGIAPGQQVEIGREPNHPGLALPDRRGQDNIRWCSGARAARARESQFTLDRALAGRKQAAVLLGQTGATVVSLHERCPTYVVRAGALERVRNPVTVRAGDLIVAGTSVVTLRESGT